MKTVMMMVCAMIFSSAPHADPVCSALADFVGSYRLVSQTCKGPYGAMGDKMVVEPYSHQDGTGFSLTSGERTIAPSLSPNSTDQCMVSGADVKLQTCALSSTCRPQGWTYQFSGNTVAFLASGCEAKYTRE